MLNPLPANNNQIKRRVIKIATRRTSTPKSTTNQEKIEVYTVRSNLIKLKSDLELFLRAKQHYHRLGRVWKRSYLLYESSRTGKSSFVAAMTNLLSYDVYEIDLSSGRDDSTLKAILLQATRRLVIVIEDLDRLLMEKSQLSVITLLGFLN
ncbi:AAA-ATPase At2g46620 [Linum grandiflorum]